MSEVSVSRVPVTVGPPAQVLTIPYGDLVVSGTLEKNAVAVLHRHATARSVVLENTTDVAVTAAQFWIFDSSLDALNNAGGGQTYVDSAGVSANAYGQYTSEEAPVLATHFDSVQLWLTIGATAPTTGSVSLYVTESFA